MYLLESEYRRAKEFQGIASVSWTTGLTLKLDLHAQSTRVKLRCSLTELSPMSAAVRMRTSQTCNEAVI